MSCPWDIAQQPGPSCVRGLRPHHGRLRCHELGSRPHSAIPTADRPCSGWTRKGFVGAIVRSTALTAEEVSTGTRPRSWNSPGAQRVPAAGSAPVRSEAGSPGSRARCRAVGITPDMPVAESRQARARSDHRFESNGRHCPDDLKWQCRSGHGRRPLWCLTWMRYSARVRSVEWQPCS